MKLITFSVAGEQKVGLVAGEGVVDLTSRTGVRSLRALLESGTEGAEAHQSDSADFGLPEVDLLPPVVDPWHIIGIGLNTHSHFLEMSERQANYEMPTHPRLFMRSPFSHVGHGGSVEIPRVSGQLDYEGELAVIIGKPMRYVPAASALDHVAGYSCYNDGSVRDYQRHTNQTTAGKNFARSGAFGPYLVTADEAPPLERLELTTRVNGTIRQEGNYADFIFSVPQLLAYLSEIYPLQPGDVILTGSPAGIGAASKTWLQRGDVVQVTIPGIGTLEHNVRLE